MEKMKVLITGATGFVGPHLIHRLVSVPTTRRQIFGTCFPEHPESCADLCEKAPGLELLHLDLKSEMDVSDAVQSIRPEWIFHLASVSQVRVSWEKRKETLETNLMGTFFLYEAVRRYAPKARILFVSSSDVYGIPGPRHKPFGEGERLRIVSPYAFTKASGELLSEFYAGVEKLNLVIARPFPHTGPGQTADFVCSDWGRQIALIEKTRPSSPAVKVGNLETKRDYSDVRDVVRAYVMLMKKGRRGEVYNVCSGQAPALKTILRTLLTMSARPIKVELDPAKLRKSDIPFLAGDNHKINRETGWKPRIPLRQTLSDLLDFWRATV